MVVGIRGVNSGGGADAWGGGADVMGGRGDMVGCGAGGDDVL
jgi:hypothetical protein